MSQASAPKTNQPDYDALVYVASPPQSLYCPVCKNVLIDPVQTSCEYRHTLCARCITRALDDRLECPVDRSPMPNGEQDCSPAARLIVQVLDELDVYCPNEGCGRILPRHTVYWHMNDECPFQLVQCDDEACKQLSLRNQSMDGECTHTRINCDHCDQEILPQDLDRHLDQCSELSHQCPHCHEEFASTEMTEHSRTCNSKPRACTAVGYGCSWQGTYGDGAQHESSCPINQLRPYLIAQDEKLAKMELENRAMREEIIAMKSNSANESVIEVSSAYERDRTYLFQTLEGLSTGIDQLSASLSSLDTRQSHVIMSESHRSKEEITMMRGAIQSLRVQWHHFIQNARGPGPAVHFATKVREEESLASRQQSAKQTAESSRVKL